MSDANIFEKVDIFDTSMTDTKPTRRNYQAGGDLIQQDSTPLKTGKSNFSSNQTSQRKSHNFNLMTKK